MRARGVSLMTLLCELRLPNESACGRNRGDEVGATIPCDVVVRNEG